MSRAHDGQRLFPFGNPLRMMFPKEAHLPPPLLAMLNSFEATMADILKNLRPKDTNDVLSFSWLTLAMTSLCRIHTNIKLLISELDFPVSDWDQKWMDVYLENSVRLLDICNTFSSELSRLARGQLYLQCVRHALDVSDSPPSSVQLTKSRASLDEWMQQISTGNARLDECSGILHGLAGSLHSPKIKDSAKGRVLMRAMYGVRVSTIFICGVLASAFSGSSKPLMSLQVSEKLLWAKAFNDVQFTVNGEIRRLFSNGNTTVLKELEAVASSVKKLHPLTQNVSCPTDVSTLKASVSELGGKIDNFTEGLDSLKTELEGFFQILLTSRDALMYSLRVNGSFADLKKQHNLKQQVVR